METKSDKIPVNRKINYSEKIKGACAEEGANLVCPENSLPYRITRRVLSTVAQCQYSPLGLLSVLMIRWRPLMRRGTLDMALVHCKSSPKNSYSSVVYHIY